MCLLPRRAAIHPHFCWHGPHLGRGKCLTAKNLPIKGKVKCFRLQTITLLTVIPPTSAPWSERMPHFYQEKIWLSLSGICQPSGKICSPSGQVCSFQQIKNMPSSHFSSAPSIYLRWDGFVNTQEYDPTPETYVME